MKTRMLALIALLSISSLQPLAAFVYCDSFNLSYSDEASGNLQDEATLAPAPDPYPGSGMAL